MIEKTLFIFIDESGNFDFSSGGTKYFILTAVSTIKPLNGREKLLEYRYQLLSEKTDQEYFHATEDKQTVRDGVYSLVSGYDDFFIDSVVAQKNKANPSLYSEMCSKKGKFMTKIVGAEFYRIVCQTLLQYIFRRFNSTTIEKIGLKCQKVCYYS